MLLGFYGRCTWFSLMSLIWNYFLENVLTPKECTPLLVCLLSQCQSYFKSCYTLNNRSLYHVRANSQCSQSSQLFTAISWKLAAIFHCDTGTPAVLISVSGKIHHDMISYTSRFGGSFQKDTAFSSTTYINTIILREGNYYDISS